MSERYRGRVVSLTLVPSYSQTEYVIGPEIERKLTSLVNALGPNCRVCKFQWLVATDESCGAITQDLSHEGVENVLCFAFLLEESWKWWCKPRGEADVNEFDGVAAFFQLHLDGRSPSGGE